MKQLILKGFYSFLILSFVFAFGMTTGNTYFAAGLTGLTFAFSLLYHSGVFGKVALEAPVVPEFNPKSKAEINDLTPEELDEYLAKRKAYDDAVLAKKQYDQIEALKTELSGDRENLEKM